MIPLNTKIKIRKDSVYYGWSDQGDEGYGYIIENTRLFTDYKYKVQWDNGNKNVYRDEDLQRVTIWI